MSITPNEILFLEASRFYGLKEVAGEENNPIIMGWAKDLGFKWVQNDETAWCSLFINWLCWKHNFERSNKLNARSWLDIGHQVEVPQLGDIIVLWRDKPDSWKGHVGLYNGEDKRDYYVLGGNQSNMIRTSPYIKEMKLAFIRL